MFYFEISGARGTCKINFLETVFKVVGCLVLFTEKIRSMFYEGLMGWIFTFVCSLISIWVHYS